MSGASSPNPRGAEIGRIGAPLPCPAPRLAPDEPAVAGLVPFSSVDWPGNLAAVLFLVGCPWRCHYCHNAHLQRRHAAYRWAELVDWLGTRAGLLDAVVLSGGEPLSEPRLPELARQVRALGFKVALHTAGIYPDRLAAVLPHLDWVALDIKSDADGHDALIGRAGGHPRARSSLAMLLASGCAFECRTTWDPAWLSEARLLALARDLADLGVSHYAVQAGRENATALPAASLGAAAREQLAAWFPVFEYRVPQGL